jgi:lipopolysaccharide export system protein LptA
MAESGPARPPFQRARRVLLGSALALLAAVGSLYLLGRRSAPAPDPPADGGDTPRNEREREALVLSEGFQYEQRVGERSAFELRGERFATDREGVTTLEEVGLELTREGGDRYLIESRRATYDSRSGEARLSGDVRLAGARGFRLETDRLDLTEGGRTVVSRTPVRFATGELTGRAAGMRLEFEADRFVLRGNVRATGAESPDAAALALQAETVVFDRGAHLLSASGGVELVANDDRVTAPEIDLQLSDDDRSPRLAVLRGGVAGRVAPEPDESAVSTPIEFEGASGRVAFEGEPSRPSAIELDGAGDAPAKLSTQAADGGRRTLRAPRLTAFVAAGRPTRAAATGGVVVAESAAGGAREVRAREADAGFGPGGELGAVTLTGGVELTAPDLRAAGERGEFDFSSGKGWLAGGGGSRARAATARGELEAPRIEFEQAGGVVRGREGVIATLRAGAEGARIGPSAAEGGEPIRVEAREADLRDADRTWAFRGDVRAVQGKSLLFADRLSGSEAEGTALGSGSVRTVWEENAPADGAPRSPITVSAEQVSYRRQADEPGSIEYSGGVLARQESRELAAERVVVELDAEQRARRMTATGQVRLDDRSSGRSVNGSSATHDLEARTVLVEGDPVVLAEPDGTKVRGRRLLYDVAAGTARMLTAEDAP